MGDDYRLGDFYRICDRTGFKVRASQTSKEWNGLIVRDKSCEPRQSQDFVRGVPDRQDVPDPRPEPAGRAVGNPTTSLASEGDPGDTIISVYATEGMVAGDTLQIVTDSGLTSKVISSMGGVGTATGGYPVTLTTTLNAEASVGNAVTDRTRFITATDSF